MKADSLPRLDEYSKEEWFDVARSLKPGLSDEEYDRMWLDFCAMKAEHERKRALH